ncbi:MAG: class I SAM-dependent methyltransferase [Actinomycetota bacterium]|nr:class I SAM-dependent methyltransferase [Actinomycetota bacterium]MDA8074997.1 class I SAM-dependent methyltransferase [Actinomycetota bacterium]
MEVERDVAELRAVVDQFTWYHSIDLGDGVVTPGMFDHRAAVDRYLVPEDLSGLRCLDVGTMDGFWAFTMERRGAAEVVALDVEDPEALDWPPALRPRIVKTLDETKADRFELVRRALGSKVQRQICSVYDLGPQLGRFDVVFCGDLLVHLKDPVTAVQRIHGVTGHSAIVANPVKEHFLYRRRPLAQFDGIAEFEWWLPNQAALERLMASAGFVRLEAGRPFDLPAVGGGPWKGRRGVVRGFVDD